MRVAEVKFQTNLGALATDPTLESSILQTVARICRRCHKALFWLLSADSQMSNRVLVDGLGGKKPGSLASRERSDSELGHWRNKLTGQRPPTRAGLGARQPSVGVIHTKFPRPAPSSSREKAHSSDPASTSAPNGTPSPLLPAPRSSSRPNLTDTPPFLLHPSPWHQPPTMSSALPLEIATDLFNTIDFSKKSLLSTSDPSLGGGT